MSQTLTSQRLDEPGHAPTPLEPRDTFARRHIGPDDAEIRDMLRVVGAASLDDLVSQTIPASIRLERELDLPPALGESDALAALRGLAQQNVVRRSCIGMGYSDTVCPPVILRNLLENPGWYTQYTPYQAEISQGRLEALLNFQTMIADLTGLPIANASLLDEATAAAEAMVMALAGSGEARNRFVIDDQCHPQTIEVCRTRARALGLEITVCPLMREPEAWRASDAFGVLVQYPDTSGSIRDWREVLRGAREARVTSIMATDPLALTLLTPPGELGADIAVGSAQRFGVPMGFGGPHAAFLAARESFTRKMPGRIIGVSRDAHGNPALRMAIQTREQHIRREKATSNICTAQALLASIAGMYAVYHGSDGLREIAKRVHALTSTLATGLVKLGHGVCDGEGWVPFFDTLRVRVSGSAQDVVRGADRRGINLRDFGDGTVGVSLDETSDAPLVRDLLASFGGAAADALEIEELLAESVTEFEEPFARASPFLTHPVFNTHHSETQMLRYLTRLQSRDLSLANSMIPLGSCTMKLNATSEMIPVTWPEFGRMHPFAPSGQTRGYREMLVQLESWLAEITGLDAVSLQPNAGSQGEYAGLLAIRAYHESRDEGHRRVCLIPTSAHGTNPASAVAAGMRVVTVACDARGNIDVSDLRSKAEAHASELAALMVTYPSTHGVFEPTIREICDVVHRSGGQVYLDGANMNAQVGLCRPGDFGADVCHLNLHKTFCIPHGGGGPGMGPIGVAEHLAPFLPTHGVVAVRDTASSGAVGAISAAPWGSASILPISWMYIAMMGAQGLRRATEVAILSANYMAERLRGHYDVLFRGEQGRVAHEFILDCRGFEKSAGVRVEDIAKRLMDYGFHAPTMSFPVPGTLMIEPTESEDRAELDRFCDALIAIREEIRQVETGVWAREDNPLKHSPHTIGAVSADLWSHTYPRERAAFPLPWLREWKFWPSVGRIDNPYGDRNLVCTCPPVADHVDP
ncbi:MAG: aminomethyl-transferring glycine dehydrogenase [Phycisphaeraceae bacterium]|nr:aminomethyl-transferring glycine dehydrogenase [Phycisphaeraceae bacterium]